MVGMVKSAMVIVGGATAALIGWHVIRRGRPASAAFAPCGWQAFGFDIDDDVAADIIRRTGPAIERALKEHETEAYFDSRSGAM